jgi:hypothetical protein
LSYQATEAVLKHSRAVGSDRLVLLVLAYHADAEDFACHPSRDLLCAEAGMCERNLQFILKRLEESGELTISRGNGRTHLTRYKLNLKRVKRVQGSSPFTESEKGEKGAEDFTLSDSEKGEKGETDFTHYSPERVKRVKGPSPFTESERVKRVKNSALKGEIFPGAYKDVEESGERARARACAHARETSPLPADAGGSRTPSQPSASGSVVVALAPPPRAARSPDDLAWFLRGLAWLCELDLELLHPRDANELSLNAQEMLAGGVKAEEFEPFRRWWRETDWRGQKGEVPTPKLVRQLWAQFRKSTYARRYEQAV